MHSGSMMLLHAILYLLRDRPPVHIVPLGNEFVHHALHWGRKILLYKREPNLAETFIHPGLYPGYDAVQPEDQRQFMGGWLHKWG